MARIETLHIGEANNQMTAWVYKDTIAISQGRVEYVQGPKREAVHLSREYATALRDWLNRALDPGTEPAEQ